MPRIRTNGIDLAYETHGDPSHPPMLMIQGLGMPLTGWPDAFVQRLLGHGFHLILFDNRDIGRSELIEHAAVPNVAFQMLKRRLGLRAQSCYQLRDMASDAVGLMDAIGVDAAHVVGISMGGMIAQLLAIHAPKRTRSLTSIMSTTGNRKLPGAARAVEKHILAGPAEPTRESRLEYQLALWDLIGSAKFPMPVEQRREWLLRHFERGLTADGIARQLLAIMAAPDRTAELRRLRVPTLVLHGEDDPLVPVECGRATAAAIPDARLLTFTGMGHDLPEALQPVITERIAKHAHFAAAVPSASG